MKDSYGSERRRPRSTPEQRADWVRRYERSGLSQREFAERHHLGLFNLRRWIAQNAVPARAGKDARAVWRGVKRGCLAGAARWGGGGGQAGGPVEGGGRGTAGAF